MRVCVDLHNMVSNEQQSINESEDDCKVEEPSTLRIYEFSPKDQLPEFGAILYTGRSGSGKTVVIEDMMYHYRDKVDQVVVFCGSKDTCRMYEKHVPGAFVYHGFDADKLKSIYEEQERRVELGSSVRLLIIMDDLAYLKKAINSDPTLVRILYNGRHAKIMLFLSMQYCKNITPDLRGQAKLIFACNEKNPQNREKLYDAFNPVFRNFLDFDKCMKTCTMNREVFVLNNQHTNSDDICDNVNYFKAYWKTFKKKNKHDEDGRGRKFKMAKGSRMWDYNTRRYDRHHFLQSKKDKDLYKKNKKRTPNRPLRGGDLQFLDIVKRGKRNRSEKKSKRSNNKHKKSSHNHPTFKRQSAFDAVFGTGAFIG